MKKKLKISLHRCICVISGCCLALPPAGALCTGAPAGPEAWSAGLLAGFSSIGIRVPQDVAVLGFDNRDFAALLNPPLFSGRRESCCSSSDTAKRTRFPACSLQPVTPG